MEETSAGGLVVDRTGGTPRVALIGRVDRRGRLLWSLPKGTSRTARPPRTRRSARSRRRPASAAGWWPRWARSTTGSSPRTGAIHKTVHHYLLEASGGELSDADVEVDEVAWVPLGELAGRLAYAGERRLAETAADLLADTA